MSKPYQAGNTIRLRAKFKGWDDEPLDPGLVKVLIYDGAWKKLREEPLGPANRIDVGYYYFDFVPDRAAAHIIEWYGEIDGLPSLKREQIQVKRL